MHEREGQARALAPEQQIPATHSAEVQLRAHRSVRSNLLPGEGGGERPRFLSQGWGSPCSISRERDGLKGWGHVCRPAPCLLPGAMPAPSHLASARHGHPARPGVPLPPCSSVTHPLQGEINTSAHVRRSTEKSFSWEWGRGGCFLHASSTRLALRSLPLSWVWEMALASRPAEWW